MARDYWSRHQALLRSIDELAPPILVGVPGSLLGIEVPFLPRPGRLHIVIPYECDAHIDLDAMNAMRFYCGAIEKAA
jgi:hypothetical protein